MTTTLTIDPAQQEQTQTAQVQQTQAPATTQTTEVTKPAPGTPEYDAAMAAKGAALRQQFEEQRPEWLPEKFWADGKADYAALAQSYQELEKKLGVAPTAQTQATQQGATTDTTKTQSGVDFSKYEQEFMASGQLSEASYDELVSKGIPKSMVDAYVAGQQALVQKTTSELLKTVGGVESFNAMKAWAATNLTESELTMFNSQVTAGATSASMALQWLQSKYQSSNPGSPRLLQGSNQSVSYGNGFRSLAEVTAAISDKRYATDPAYREDVARRLAAKQF